MTGAVAERAPVLAEALALARAARAPRLRGLEQFFREEIVIPDGPHQGRRWRPETQPYARLLFAAIESGRWRRFAVTGPTQSGKTLHAFVGLAMYHLFECGETVILAAPTMDMAADKWGQDLRPAIERSRYREQIPTRGAGSRGGRTTGITFRNGATLRWMTGGGSDKSVAGFTSRIVIVTETDGMDVASEESREADRITQIEERTAAYGDRARIYLECTVSTPQGRTWREYQAGTRSRIALRCPACGQYVTPEREHLVGWKAAEDELGARAGARWMCPRCEVLWTEEDRRAANLGAVLLHGEQRVVGEWERGLNHRDTETQRPEGEGQVGIVVAGDGRRVRVVGEVPRTVTLGFRWSAVNNMFKSAADVGEREWRAVRGRDEHGEETGQDDAEKALRQFVHALPWEPPRIEVAPLNRRGILGHVVATRRGVLPAGTVRVTCGVDLQKDKVYWFTLAWVRREGELNHRDTGAQRPEAERTGGAWMHPHVVDYGSAGIDPSVPVDVGTLGTLRRLEAEVWGPGWPVEGTTERRGVDMGLVDSGWYESQEAAYEFARRSGGRWLPSKGHSTRSRLGGKYSGVYVRPEARDGVMLGDGYHVALQRAARVWLAHVNADLWKTRLHEALHLTVGTPGALTLCYGEPEEHERLVRHLTAERRKMDTAPGGRVVVVWEQTRRGNHLLDCAMEAMCAGHLAGALARPAQQQWVDARREQHSFGTSDGRPYLVTQR